MKKILIAVLLFITLSAGIGVMAFDRSGFGWLDWDGSLDLDNSQDLVDALVADVIALDGEVTTLQDDLDEANDLLDAANAELLVIDNQANAWLLELDPLFVDPWTVADIDNSGTTTTIEKLLYYESNVSSNNAGGVAALNAEILQLEGEILGLEADILAINDALDAAIEEFDTTTDLTALTEAEKIAMLTTQIATMQDSIDDLDAELAWVNFELDTANTEAAQFATDVCTAIDLLPQGQRDKAAYNDICGDIYN